MQRHTFRTLSLLMILGSFILLACDLGLPTAGKPTIILSSPPHGSQFREGEDVAFQSTATDSTGVTRVELMIDGTVVKTDTVPGTQGQPSFTLVQTWKATQGTHAASVRAYNTSSAVSDPATVTITVSSAAAQPPAPTAAPATAAPTPVPSAIATAAGACTNASAFVSDVTVPDGTLLAPGQTFNKIWRVRNSGTCPWGAGYQLVFVTGEAMTATTAIAVPDTAAGATADLLVAMAASTTPGVHAGQWRLKSPAGALFGANLSVSVNVTSPAAPTVTTVPPPASGTCISGFVWRMASPTDKVCVPPASRDQAQLDNAAAESRKLLEYGPDTCILGYVWREAYSGDHVCVTGAVRSQAAADNAAAASRWVSGAYGPHTCITGFVWREARSSPLDDVCVTGAVRTQTASDNAAAASRVVVAPYGPDTCKTGYVWREAWSGDHVCVTGAVRSQVAADNAAAPSRTNP